MPVISSSESIQFANGNIMRDTVKLIKFVMISIFSRNKTNMGIKSFAQSSTVSLKYCCLGLSTNQTLYNRFLKVEHH